MKKLIFVITVVLMACGGGALANYNANNVGVYFDPAGTELCLSKIDEIATHHVYVVLTKLYYPIVAGFELNLATDGPLALSNYTFPAGSAALNMLTPPSFMVGFGIPLEVVERTVVVMEFDILIFSLNPVSWDEFGDAHVFVKEVFFHSLPEEVPAYLNGAGELVELHQSTGTEEDAVMVFSLDASGCGAIVANDQTSWDSLKSLYR